MPLTVDPITHVISIPLSYLTLVSAGLYDCDTNQVRLDLRVWEATEEGRAEPKTHVHAPAFTVAGSTLAPGFKLVNDYSVEFEDGNHSVRLKNTNNNLFDVADNRLVKNNVLVIPGNSFGLVQVTSGSGVTAQDKVDIVNQVFARIIENGESFEEQLRLIRAEAAGSIEVTGDTHKIKSADGAKDRITATATAAGRTATAIDSS